MDSLITAGQLHIGDRFRVPDSGEPATVTRVYSTRGERVIEVAAVASGEPIRFIGPPGTMVELLARDAVR